MTSPHKFMCPLCDQYHVEGACPEGLPVTRGDCPFCERDGRGKNPLRQFLNSDIQKMVWACAFCPYGHTPAKRRATARRRRRVRR